MKNEKIRSLARRLDVKYWQIADCIGISQSTFTVWLRHELPPDREAMIEAAIYKLAGIDEGKDAADG